MIDAQSVILGKGELAIVPPTVYATFAMVKPESIYEPPGAEIMQSGTRLRVEQYSILPGGRVVHVSGVRGDVEITTESKQAGWGAVAVEIAP
jgi:hypothetical protein